jgi:Nif-specific regulatory protein
MAAALEQSRERRRLEALLEIGDLLVDGELVGASEPMQRLRRETQLYAAARDTSVLIRGESGTGKELVARTLHARSARSTGPFVVVNCAAIPETMIESELFGHERGAFTGAVKQVRGKLALADGGTIFLDEVGDLALAAQAKLLRALEYGEVQPLGSERVLEVDVRVISATHKDLEREIKAGRFREDLYYRLAVGKIDVPPLRARGDDAVQLAGMFLERYAVQLGKRIAGLGPAALDTLRRHPWPGNVRQLRNEIERAAILCDGAIVEELGVGVPAATSPAPGPVPTLEEAERRHIESALREHDGNILATARAIGVSRGLLYRKIARYGIKV